MDTPTSVIQERIGELLIDDNKECLLRRLFLPVGMV